MTTNEIVLLVVVVGVLGAIGWWMFHLDVPDDRNDPPSQPPNDPME